MQFYDKNTKVFNRKNRIEAAIQSGFYCQLYPKLSIGPNTKQYEAQSIIRSMFTDFILVYHVFSLVVFSTHFLVILNC